MSYVFEEALEAAASVKRYAGDPVLGFILGSGLGVFAQRLREPFKVPYTRIPNFPPARVEGHAGQLVFAEVAGVRIAVLSGRVHYYEGYGLDTVTLPTRTLALLGVRGLVVTNAAGGIREDLTPGDLMVVTDHINLMGRNPLMGEWDPRLGPRHPDLTTAYDPALREAIHEAARRRGLELKDGVYAAMMGPSYETPAEIRMLDRIGADAVGMSTVPEVIVANQMGLSVAGISCIANRAAGLGGRRLSHAEVMQETAKAADRFCDLLFEAIPLLAEALPVEREAKERSAVSTAGRSVGRTIGKKKRGRKR